MRGHQAPATQLRRPVFCAGWPEFDGWIPATLVKLISEASSWGLLIAIAAVGMKTSFKGFWSSGSTVFYLVIAETLLLAAIFVGAIHWMGLNARQRAIRASRHLELESTCTALATAWALSKASSMLSPRANATPMRRFPLITGLPNNRIWVSTADKAASKFENSVFPIRPGQNHRRCAGPMLSNIRDGQF